MSKNLIMVDHAIHDSRSCLAMLSGLGDNREQAWIAFEKRYPEFNSQEVLMEFFSREARCGRILPNNIFTKYLSRRFYIAIALILIVAL